MLLSTEIASVSQIPVKPFEGKFGPTWFIEGNFKDGSYFSRGAKSVEQAQKLHAQLTDLVGKPQDFEVEDSNREYQGKKKWNLKAVPGQENRQGAYGFKGGSFQGRPASPSRDSYRYSEQGTREERDSIVRQVALKCSVELTVAAIEAKKAPVDVLQTADALYEWLSKAAPKREESMPPYERYSNEIALAVKANNSERLTTLCKMIQGSLQKNTITVDQAAALDDELTSAKKAISSAAAHAQWYQQKQEHARQTQPVHESADMAETITQSQEAF